jgi:Leucine-rich repeat (LRR) protein
MKFIIIFITLFIIYFWVKEQIKEKKITNSINENILKKKKIHKQEVASRITIKEMYSYFHFFAFSKSLNMAVVQAFKDVDILRTIYTYDSFPVVSSGLFSPYLYKEKRIESTMKSRGNGILEVEYNGGVINLEEELHTINPFLKMIELKIYDGNKDLNSIYSILFFVEGVGEKIHHYVITNEIDANKKKVLSIDSEGYSLLIKSINNDEFNIRKVIDEIASTFSVKKDVDIPIASKVGITNIDWWHDLEDDLKKRLNFFVNIPSHNFDEFDKKGLSWDKKIINFIDINGVVEVPCEDKVDEMLKLESLDLSNLNIENLKFLNCFNHLKWLNLDNNRIIDISPLVSLKNLKTLLLKNNENMNFALLKKIQCLEFLVLGKNNIQNIDFLSELINLKYLSLNENNIEDITPLKNLINLNSLSINDNSIQNIDFLSELINLEYLSLSENNIEDIAPLKNLINLECLVLDDNKIQDIFILKKLTNLITIRISQNQLKDIDAFSELTNLESMSFKDNQVRDIMPLKNLKKIEYLSLCDNPISLDDKQRLSHLLPKWEYKIDITDILETFYKIK